MAQTDIVDVDRRGTEWSIEYEKKCQIPGGKPEGEW